MLFRSAARPAEIQLWEIIMTKRQWINAVGNSWKGAQLRAMIRPVPYVFWRLHVGIVNSKSVATRATFGALHFGLDARKLGDAAERVERRA